MPQKAVPNGDHSVCLSILYLRCTYNESCRKIKMTKKPFNSLFEMLIRRRDTAREVQKVAFNSLFEMRTDATVSAAALSLTTFNSLFEMPGWRKCGALLRKPSVFQFSI